MHSTLSKPQEATGSRVGMLIHDLIGEALLGGEDDASIQPSIFVLEGLVVGVNEDLTPGSPLTSIRHTQLDVACDPLEVVLPML